MSDIAIRIESLSKLYHIGGPKPADRTFREALMDALKAPVRRLEKKRKAAEAFWALDDVSLEIRRGEAVGIIGRNGAGKSTLLKVLSRITGLTKGRVDIYGRVGSLLEVGTGFHPELTGRENIFLNGAILGMSRNEIQRRFDEIVEFAEIEHFLDTPVKHYSSGMYVRLAFAVAAHLEPEILLIDEVLAVGDAAFQKKCLGKMDDVTHSGRTVVFISHQMAFIENLCSRAVWLDAGRVMAIGNTSEIVNQYMQEVHEKQAMNDLGKRTDRQGNGLLRFQQIWLEGNENSTVDFFRVGDRSVSINTLITPQTADSVEGSAVLVINDVSGYHLLTIRSEDKDTLISVQGPSVLTFALDRIHLMPGTYYCNLYFGRWGGNEAYDFVENALALRIEPGDFHDIGKVLPPQPEKFIVKFDIICRPTRST